MLESFKSALVRSTPIVLGLLVICLIMWPVIDLACALFISHEAFHYSVALHVLRPLLFVGLYAVINIIGNMFTKRPDPVLHETRKPDTQK